MQAFIHVGQAFRKCLKTILMPKIVALLGLIRIVVALTPTLSQRERVGVRAFRVTISSCSGGFETVSESLTHGFNDTFLLKTECLPPRRAFSLPLI